ncbi:hypothetical protein [Ruminococcus albus]|uniref:DUF5082 domain-containing protein n=1 Tax=Ruminococcus albus TaxID=1264 RepID=A0A1I1RY03_RUMAL|nr:hypothetical protein [Ruminococcus albus]SFD35520.1 hypothetical protein SAMN02910406_03734 [Ruminococcus albus]
MTSGEAHSCYLNAKSKYEEAISEKNACADSKYRQEILKREAQVRLNDFTADKNRYTTTNETLVKANIRDKVDGDLNKVHTEMDDATSYFKTLGESSMGTIDLTKHIMNEDDKTHRKSVVGRIFTNIDSAKKKVENKITELEASIKKTNGEIDAAETEIRRLEGQISYWDGVKNEKSNEMEMYLSLERRLAAEEEEARRKAEREAAEAAAAAAAANAG